ncbi:MAG: xanthine dehydrogenase family protein subunit M [Gemmatimonadetes bacterium]|nr:xanthine dehydrogenase family protein subunit M [Gemmatimonadota bacterium]
MLKDMMPHFELFQPSSLENALDLADRLGDDGWALAVGHDSFNSFKNRSTQIHSAIDLAGIAELQGIRETPDGVEIGAMATLTEVERHPLIRERYGLLADAVGQVASPQIRNSGTLGGNVCQDTRCWYYRFGLSCYRAGGNVCYADAPEAMNREHCLFGANRCVAVTPSDAAPALVALDASMVIRSSSGERVVRAEDFFMEPSRDIRRMTVLKPSEILTTIQIPAAWAGAKFYFEKVADRKAWDFALVSVAAAIKVNGNTIEDIRIVCGAVQCIPRRLTAVEQAVKGSPQNEQTAERAGAMAVRGARPLNYNHFKMPLMENLVKRAIRDA